MTAGNVLNFGADPLGNDDSYPAFQAAVDSPHAVDVPPGYYYLSQPVVFTKPKIVKMTRPLLEPFDSDPRRRAGRGPGPNVPESHTRLWTDQNINFFEIRSPQVFIDGGCFDAQKVVGWNKAALYYSGDAKDHNSRANGWGGGARDFLVIGNYLDLLGLVDGSPGQSGSGVRIDFENYTMSNAYWTHMEWRGRVVGLSIGWESTDTKTGVFQWGNQCDIKLDVDHCKQAIVNRAIAELKVQVRHQASHVFKSQEDADTHASIESHTGHSVFDKAVFFDFGTGSGDLTGNGDIRFKNSKTYNITEEDPIYPRHMPRHDWLKAINLSNEPPLYVRHQIFLLNGGYENWIKWGDNQFYWQDDNGKIRTRDRRPPINPSEGQPASD